MFFSTISCVKKTFLIQSEYSNPNNRRPSGRPLKLETYNNNLNILLQHIKFLSPPLPNCTLKNSTLSTNTLPIINNVLLSPLLGPPYLVHRFLRSELRLLAVYRRVSQHVVQHFHCGFWDVRFHKLCRPPRLPEWLAEILLLLVRFRRGGARVHGLSLYHEKGMAADRWTADDVDEFGFCICVRDASSFS